MGLRWHRWLLEEESIRFNRFCAGFALLWLLTIGGGSLVLRPKMEDFAQYYLGAAIVLDGSFEALYPQPIEDAKDNAGWQHASVMRPAYARLAQERGVGDRNRYQQPPPLALLLAPLALLKYQAAFGLWIVLMILSVWGCALLAGAFFVRCHGKAARLAGLLIVFVAGSPLAYRTIRTGQISPLVALATGYAVWDLLRGGGVGGALALLFGTLAKYSPASVGLLVLATRRWRFLLVLLGGSSALLAASLIVMGTTPYKVFLQEIVPTFRYSTPWRGNQSLAGFLLRASGGTTLSPEFSLLIGGVGVVFVAAIVVWLWRAGVALRRSPPAMCATAAALTAWWAISSPIFWEHYYTYFLPFWGWLAYEATRGRLRCVFGAVIGALTWLPLAVVPRWELSEPLASHMFWSVPLLMVLAMGRWVEAWRVFGSVDKVGAEQD